MTSYEFAAIETLYRGVRFRSRLEAKWAAFFDMARWEWNYEPFDLKGWIPDFSIYAKGSPNNTLLIEVKPYVDLDTMDKIDRSDREHEVLLLSSTLLLDSNDVLALGMFREVTEGVNGLPGPTFWGFGSPGRWSGNLGVRPEWGHWSDRISGEYNGNEGAEYRCPEVKKMFREAGNAVRWEKSK